MTYAQMQAEKALFSYCSKYDSQYRLSDGCPFCNLHGGAHSAQHQAEDREREWVRHKPIVE